VSVVVVFNIFHLKEVRDEREKLKDTISSKDKKLARMNKAFGNKVKYLIIVEFNLNFSFFFSSSLSLEAFIS